MKILGVDYGQKRIGLALVATEVDVVVPIGVVGTKEELVARIRSESIDEIVIGMPTPLTGGESPHTEQIRTVGAWLEETTGVPVFFVDERYSSHGAARMRGGVSTDEKAAMILLEHYLDVKKRDAL